MQHLCLFIYHCLWKGCYWLTAFPLSKSTSFSTSLVASDHCCFHTFSNISNSWWSLCLKNCARFYQQQKHSFLCCLRDAFCHADLSAWEGCQFKDWSSVGHPRHFFLWTTKLFQTGDVWEPRFDCKPISYQNT